MTKKEGRIVKGKDVPKKKLLTDKFVKGIVKTKNLYFDPGQPRQRFFFEKIERLTASISNGVLFNRPIIERMDYQTFHTYLTSIDESKLQKKYLEDLKREKKKYYDVLVVGASRDLSIIMSGFEEVPVYYSPKLTIEERRDLQIHEDSQLAPKQWHEARSNVHLFELMNEERKLKGEKTLSYSEFARHKGIGEERFKEQRDYVYTLSPKIHKLVEVQKSLDYNVASLIARHEKDYEKQLLLASKGHSKKDLETMIVESKKSADLPEISNTFSLSILEEKENSKTNELLQGAAKMHSLIHKSSRLGELNGQNIFKKNGLIKAAKELESIVLEMKGTIDEDTYLAAKKRADASKAKHHFTENIVDIIEKVRENVGKYKTKGVKKLRVLEPKYISVDKISIDINARFGPQFRYSKKEEEKLVKELEIEQLADSIMHEGLINPIWVENRKGEVYLNQGFRRWLAHRLIYRKTKDKTWLKIPAINAGKMTPLERFEYMVDENTQTPFSPGERARAWYASYMAKLARDPNLTIKSFAQMIGKKYDVVQDSISYMALLPKSVRDYDDEKLTHYSTLMEIAKKTEQNGIKILSEEDQLILADEAAILGIDGKTMRKRITEYISAKNSKQGSLDFEVQTDKFYYLAREVEKQVLLFSTLAKSYLKNSHLNNTNSDLTVNKDSLATQIYRLEKSFQLAKKQL